MSDKYIIKNCPNLSYAIMADGTERNFQCGLEIDKYCQDCTDCVMKQIVELCKETCRKRCTNDCLGTKKHCGYGQILDIINKAKEE